MDSDIIQRTVKLLQGCERLDAMAASPGRDLEAKRVSEAAKRWQPAVVEAREDPDAVYMAAVEQMAGK